MPIPQEIDCIVRAGFPRPYGYILDELGLFARKVLTLTMGLAIPDAAGRLVEQQREELPFCVS